LKLYITPNSPYARIARVAAIESGLSARIEIINVTTRDAKTDYFKISPLARVPALVDGDILIADTRDICAHFDALTNTRQWGPSESASARTLRHIASGFLDGIAVWLRETGRPADQQSAPVIAYEIHRAAKALAWLEGHTDTQKPLNFTTLTLACALDIATRRTMALDWPEIAPNLATWATSFARRPAMQITAPD